MKKVLFLLLVFLCILPVWAFEFVPLLDYPRHLLVAFEMKNILAGVPSGFFELNAFGVPNSLGHWLLVLLDFFLPVAIAGKVFLSIEIALFVFGAKYLFDSLNKKGNMLWLFGIVFVYGVFFVLGFLNFVLGLALAFFVLGYWERNIENMNKGKTAVLAGLTLLVYLSHIAAFFSLFFVAAVAAFFYFEKKAKAVAAILPFVPALAAFAFFACAGNGGSELFPLVWSSPLQTVNDFLFALSMTPNLFGLAAMFLAVFAFYIAAVERLLEKKGRRLVFRGNKRAALFLALAPGLCLFALLPSLAGEHWPINARLPLLLFMVAAAVVAEPKKKAFRKLFGLLVFFAAVFSIAGAWLFFADAQAGIGDFVSGIPLVEKNSRLLPLNNCFELGFPPANQHSYAYYLIEKGGFAPYLGLGGMFPLKYKEGLSAVAAPRECFPEEYSDKRHAKHFDYVLSFGEAGKSEAEIGKSFEKVFEKGLFALYRKKG